MDTSGFERAPGAHPFWHVVRLEAWQSRDLRGNSAYAPPLEAGLRDDTWEWDGQQWSKVDVAGPPKRDHHIMVFDTSRGKTILYGGAVAGHMLNDTWEFDGNHWIKIETTPPTSLGADATFDSGRAKVIAYGGWRNGPLPDIWEFDGHWTRVK